MPTFQKIPVEIQALRWDGTKLGADAIEDWADSADVVSAPYLGDDDRLRGTWTLSIRTLEGLMNVSPGDWIIEGVKGELYPCKPDIFEMTYRVPAKQKHRVFWRDVTYGFLGGSLISPTVIALVNLIS